MDLSIHLATTTHKNDFAETMLKPFDTGCGTLPAFAWPVAPVSQRAVQGMSINHDLCRFDSHQADSKVTTA